MLRQYAMLVLVGFISLPATPQFTGLDLPAFRLIIKYIVVEFVVRFGSALSKLLEALKR